MDAAARPRLCCCWTAAIMATAHNGSTVPMEAAANGHTATADAAGPRGVAATDNHGAAALVCSAEDSHATTAALPAFFGAEASPEDRLVHPLLAVLHGWCRLRIAAAFRLHGLLRWALRSGVVDRNLAARVRRDHATGAGRRRRVVHDSALAAPRRLPGGRPHAAARAGTRCAAGRHGESSRQPHDDVKDARRGIPPALPAR